MTKMSKFEGREVIGTKVAIVGAGDGLSESLAIDPVELKIGATVYVLTECVVAAVSLVPVKDTQSLTRNHKLKAGTTTLVDEGFAGETLAAQADKIAEARAASKLEFEGDGE